MEHRTQAAVSKLALTFGTFSAFSRFNGQITARNLWDKNKIEARDRSSNRPARYSRCERIGEELRKAGCADCGVF